MRVVLFTGKGGVGKTTLAAATAARLARSSRRILVVSTDPAHSLGDAFGVTLGAVATEVETGLFAGHIDTRSLADAAWSSLRRHLRIVLAGAGVDEFDAEELTVLPGVEELLALAEVRRLSRSPDWECVIVDCGPTAETLRLLSLPEAIAGYVDKLYPGGRSVARGMLAGLPGGRLLDGWQSTAKALEELSGRLAALRAMLTDTDATSVRLVLTPERVVIAETRRTLTALALQGIRVDGVIANRLVPKAGLGFGPAATWMRKRRAEQDTVLAEVMTNAEVPVRVVEHRSAEPVGVTELLKVADDLYGRTDPLGESHTGVRPLLSVTGGGRGPGAEFQLRVSIPLPRSSELDLVRVGDELAITVDGRRRLIALPAVLRRCVVADAAIDSQGVLIRFTGSHGAGDLGGEGA